MANNSAWIEGWRVVEVDGCERHIVGNVFGHPEIAPGTRAITPRLIWIDEDSVTACTSLRRFHLGAKGVSPLPDDVTDVLNRALAEYGVQVSG